MNELCPCLLGHIKTCAGYIKHGKALNTKHDFLSRINTLCKEKTIGPFTDTLGQFDIAMESHHVYPFLLDKSQVNGHVLKQCSVTVIISPASVEPAPAANSLGTSPC